MEPWSTGTREHTAKHAPHRAVPFHTWNHLDLTKQTDEIVREEITRAEILSCRH